ncbi:hypothetical protein PR048_011601 [Dryococelus australis]|uniref:Tc1-like transposase DDE domain-containing protein n=1 Tax=Dryococelus australis TaxID=614101 RepID=A0ABQ9HLZ5_9NEOP|nr:hypothetical protein PR048_011601 [Dryococelus australis]
MDRLRSVMPLQLFTGTKFPKPVTHCAAVAERLDFSPPTKANRCSIPGLVTTEFSHVGIAPDGAAFRRVFSGITRSSHPRVKSRPNITTLSTQWYAGNNVRRLDWPARNPDLNPTEHLWDELDRRVRARQARPKSIAQLMEWLPEEWQRIPVDVLSFPYPRTLQSCPAMPLIGGFSQGSPVLLPLHSRRYSMPIGYSRWCVRTSLESLFVRRWAARAHRGIEAATLHSGGGSPTGCATGASGCSTRANMTSLASFPCAASLGLWLPRALLTLWAALNSDVLRADEGEVSVEQRRNEGGGGSGRSPRKPTDQRHRPARLPLAKIWSEPVGVMPPQADNLYSNDPERLRSSRFSKT